MKLSVLGCDTANCATDDQLTGQTLRLYLPVGTPGTDESESAFEWTISDEIQLSIDPTRQTKQNVYVTEAEVDRTAWWFLLQHDFDKMTFTEHEMGDSWSQAITAGQ